MMTQEEKEKQFNELLNSFNLAMRGKYNEVCCDALAFTVAHMFVRNFKDDKQVDDFIVTFNKEIRGAIGEYREKLKDKGGIH